MIFFCCASLPDGIPTAASPRTEKAFEAILEWLEGQSPGSQPRGEMMKSVLERMKAILLEAERGRSLAETDARIAASEALALRSRLCALEGTLERRTAQWEAACVAKTAGERMAASAAELRLLHFEQQTALRDRRIAALEDELKVKCLNERVLWLIAL